MSKRKYTTGELFDIGIAVRICAQSHVGESRILGDVKAEDIAEMCRDYARLRLAQGVSNHEGSGEEARPKQIEYKFVKLPRPENVERVLNEWGADGWELSATDYGCLILVRAKGGDCEKANSQA